MKTIRSLMILAGLSLAVLALGATGAKAQDRSGAEFVGTFTLPTEAQWGSTILPVGEYSLYYSHPPKGAPLMVEVIGKKKRSPHVYILPRGASDASATKSAIVCVREGDTLYVRALDLPLIGTSVNFAMLRGAQLTAHNGGHSGYTQLADAPMLIQRVPIALNAK